MKRAYTKCESLLPRVLQMKEEGKTNAEIAECLGLQRWQVKDLFTRHNRKSRMAQAGILPMAKGRPKKHQGDEDKDALIERLQMENELLRDFLGLTGRG